MEPSCSSEPLTFSNFVQFAKVQSRPSKELSTIRTGKRSTDDQWLQVVRDLSVSVESIRTVYKNLRENYRSRGFYPYEGIKHILYLMNRLGYPGQYIGPQPDLAKTRKEIIKAWKRTREQLFRELPRGSAHYHDSPFI
jgi:hypothetical protein